MIENKKPASLLASVYSAKLAISTARNSDITLKHPG